MFGIIGVAAAGVAATVGHLRSKSFVERRLRFSTLVEIPVIGVFAAAAAAILAVPVVAILPFVGTRTALAFGAGVGTGVARGANRARSAGSGANP